MSEEVRAPSGPKTKAVAAGMRYSAHNPASPYNALKHKRTAKGEGRAGEQTHARPVKRQRDTAEGSGLESDPEWASYVAHATEKECPQCGFANEADAVTCASCGYELEIVCPHCGATSLNNDWLTLCPSCDEPLYAQADEEDLYAGSTEGQEADELPAPEEDAVATRRGFDGVDVFFLVGFALLLVIYWIYRLGDLEMSPPVMYGLGAALLVFVVVMRVRRIASEK